MNAPIVISNPAAPPAIFTETMKQCGRPDRQLRRCANLFKWYGDERKYDLEPAHSFTRDRAIARYERIPPERTLIGLREVFDGAVNGQANEGATRLLLGLMLDAMPTARNVATEVYVAALVDLLADPAMADDYLGATAITPEAVAGAVRETLLRAQFVPTINELIERMKKKRAEFFWASRKIEDLQAMQCDARLALCELGEAARIRTEERRDDWE